MTLEEAKKALCRKLDISYTDIANNDLFSDADLEEWINAGILKSWDYKRWPFTLKTKSVTTVNTDYYDQPTDLMPGSIFKLIIGGKEFKDPLVFEDYLKYKEDNSSGEDKYWSMHETFIFVNKHAYTIGETMDQIGKKFPPYLTTSSQLLPFSPTTDNYENSGNFAIVHFAYSEALASEKLNKASLAELEERKAYKILDTLWGSMAQQRSLSQSTRQAWNITDYFSSGSKSSTIGNFNL